jgi:O-antigen/teichoic acid export membrane protein
LNIKDNIAKISWSILDKGLFVLFGLVMLFQIKNLAPEEFGLFSLLWALNNWLLVISDSFALQGIVQFGANYNLRARINFIATTLNSVLLLFFPLLLFLIAVLFEKSLSFNLHNTFFFLPLITISSIPRTVILKILTREFRYKEIFFVNLIYFGSMTALTIFYILELHKLTFNEMLIIFVSGGVLSSIFSIILAKNSLKFQIRNNTQANEDSNEDTSFTFRDYTKFSLPMTMISAFNSVPRSLDIFFIELTMSGGNSTFMIGIYNSAKTLFRVIDEATSAAYSLLYPIAVKYVNIKDFVTLRKTFIKAISHLLLWFILIVVASYLGVTEFVITAILPYKYHLATGIFNILILASIPLPFALLSLVVTANHQPTTVLKFVIISAMVAILFFLIAGYYQSLSLMPLGIIMYNVTLGALCYNYFKRNYGFPIKDLTQSIFDIKHLVLSFIKK